MSDLEIKADIIEVLESENFKTEHVFQSREGILGIMSLKAGKSDGIYKAADGTEMLLKKTSFWNLIMSGEMVRPWLVAQCRERL